MISKGKGKTILIVGGTGFIGHHLAIRALRLNYKVYCISKYKNKKKIKKIIYIQQNLNNKKKLFKAINHIRFNYVIYASGYIQHELFNKQGFDYINENIINFNNLISSLNLKSIRKFINFASSDEYGLAKAPQKEKITQLPLTPYSLIKRYNSALLKTLNLEFDLNYINIYTFLIYGPGQKTDRLIPLMIANFLNNKSFFLKSPKFIRDFLFIDDYTDLITILMESKKIINIDINVGSGKKIYLSEIAKKIYSKIKKGKLKISTKNISSKHQVEKLFPNLQLMNKYLYKWKPKYNLEDGLNLTIDYYKNLK